MSKPENPYAFPTESTQNGMSLRDYFAAKQAAAIRSNQDLLLIVARESEKAGVSQNQTIAEIAYSDADAMLAQRIKPQ